MKIYRWDQEKNSELKINRSISFEDVLVKIKKGDVLGIIGNPSEKRKGQKVFVIKHNEYIYYVPFVESGEEVFLKTIIPSRKLKKRYGHN